MISILIPTRNRPANLKRILESIIDTAHDLSNIEVCVYVDDDDTVSIPVLEEMSPKINIVGVQGTRIILNQICNELFKLGTGPLYFCCGDDVVFRTKNWDSIVTKKYDECPDKILLVYGSDGIQNEKIATHAFFHKNWGEIIGYLLPAQFAIAYSDVWVTEVAEWIGRRVYMPELFFEHMHPIANKANWDLTYVDKKETNGNERGLYEDLKRIRIRDANKLKEFINIFNSTYKK